MKRVILLLIVVAAAYTTYKLVKKDKAPELPKQAPMAVTESDSVTEGLKNSLKIYYQLKDAFVAADTIEITQYTAMFVVKLGNLDISKTKADPALVETAVQFQQSVALEGHNIIAATDIEAKRKHFQTLSDALFDLLRTIRYSGGKVYQQYCPMAFDNTGAAWLSDNSEINNPYFGKKMLHCGDLKDSINIQP